MRLRALSMHTSTALRRHQVRRGGHARSALRCVHLFAGKNRRRRRRLDSRAADDMSQLYSSTRAMGHERHGRAFVARVQDSVFEAGHGNRMCEACRRSVWQREEGEPWKAMGPCGQESTPLGGASLTSGRMTKDTCRSSPHASRTARSHGRLSRARPHFCCAHTSHVFSASAGQYLQLICSMCPDSQHSPIACLCTCFDSTPPNDLCTSVSQAVPLFRTVKNHLFTPLTYCASLDRMDP